MYISAVIICKNEEKNIERCIESVINNLKGFKSEIVLVDASSTDHTLQIASKYPIKIYQLNQSKFLSPSAGRYVGTTHAKGEFILFIDGDSILIGGFIKKALKIIERKDVAAVAGRMFFKKNKEALIINKKMSGKLRIVSALGGTGLYKAKILKKSGTFNPYMKGQEERELCFRIRNQRYKVGILDIPMIYHITKDLSLEEANEKAGYFTGVGQIVRKYGLRKITQELVYAQRKALLETSAVLVAIVWIILSILFRSFVLFIGDAAIFLALIALLIYKGPKKVSIYIVAKIKIFFSIIKGLFIGIKNAESFNKKIKVKKLR